MNRVERMIVMVSMVLVSTTAMQAAELNVVGMSPPRHILNAPLTTSITIDFNQPVMVSTVNSSSFRVGGRWSGPAPGAFGFSNGDQRVTYTLDAGHSFSAGEVVLVNLSTAIQASDGSPFRQGGFAYIFWTVAAPASRQFYQLDVMSNRTTPGVNTRIYGAAGADLDGDGFLDLSTVNEDSHDIRVFMNRADGTGLFHPFLQPPLPIGIEASPNEPADFNGDGNPDIAAAASSSNSVWIALGNGDGTFMPAQSVTVGNIPHGLALLDADGDADMDIVTSNTGGNNVSLLLNNGSGVFGPATNFEGGGAGEYGIATADMNNDGIFDLVVGVQASQRIVVHLGNGNGTFTQQPFAASGGSVWMVVCGDVNGDGNMDVTTANGVSSSGSILMGNGMGGLSAPSVMPTASHCVASDVGDLDGDGDMDWVLSSFGGGQWRVFTNNGAGVFTLDQTINAVSNPSCAIILDFDNDRDLDLVLTDEIADLVTLRQNIGPAILGEMNCDGRIDGKDIAGFVEALLTPGTYVAGHPQCLILNGDFSVNGSVGTEDIGGMVQALIQSL